MSAYLLFTFWLTWPSIINPRNTLVGAVGEDSTAQAAYRYLAKSEGVSVFDRIRTNSIGYPEGGFIDQRQSFYTPLSSKIRDILANFFTGIEINLIISYLSLVLSCHIGFLICRKLTNSFAIGLVGCFILSIVPYRLHWISAANDLDSTLSLLLMIWYLNFSQKSKASIKAFTFTIAFLSTLWHPWTGILILLLALGKLTSHFTSRRIMHSYSLFAILGFVIGMIALQICISLSAMPPINWRENHSPESSNLFMFSIFNPESRSFINPTLYIGLVIYSVIWIKGKQGKFSEERRSLALKRIEKRERKVESDEIKEDNLQLINHLLGCIFWTVVLLGPFSFFGVPTPAKVLNYLLPQVRNGSYGMFLIQISLILLNVCIWGLFRKDKKLMPNFPSSFLAGFSVCVLVLSIHFPVLKSVSEDTLLFPEQKSVKTHTSRWMTEILSGLNIQKARDEIESLQPGPILIFPFGTFYGDDPINCFFLTDKLHPLVNSCNFLDKLSMSSIALEVKKSGNVCDQVLIARKFGVKHFLFLFYQKSPEQQICVDKRFTEMKLDFKHRFIGDSQEVMLIEMA